MSDANNAVRRLEARLHAIERAVWIDRASSTPNAGPLLYRPDLSEPTTAAAPADAIDQAARLSRTAAGRARRVRHTEVAEFLRHKPGARPSDVAAAFGVTQNAISAHLYRGKGTRFLKHDGQWYALDRGRAPGAPVSAAARGEPAPVATPPSNEAALSASAASKEPSPVAPAGPKEPALAAPTESEPRLTTRPVGFNGDARDGGKGEILGMLSAIDAALKAYESLNEGRDRLLAVQASLLESHTQTFPAGSGEPASQSEVADELHANPGSARAGGAPIPWVRPPTVGGDLYPGKHAPSTRRTGRWFSSATHVRRPWRRSKSTSRAPEEPS